MLANLRFVASLFDIAPSGEQFTCTCLWCEHTTESRSHGVAWWRMSVHLGFADDHPEADEVPGNWIAHLETHLYPTLDTRGGA